MLDTGHGERPTPMTRTRRGRRNPCQGAPRVGPGPGAGGAADTGRPPRRARPGNGPRRPTGSNACSPNSPPRGRRRTHNPADKGDPRLGASPRPVREAPPSARGRAARRPARHRTDPSRLTRCPRPAPFNALLRALTFFSTATNVAARVLADVGEVTRFADRNRFARPGPGPRRSRRPRGRRCVIASAGGNRRMNHMIHIAAATQIRLDTERRAHYRCKLAAGRPAKRRCGVSSVGSPTPSTGSSLLTPDEEQSHRQTARAREGTAGRPINPTRSTYPRTSTLRINHFPDPRNHRPRGPVRPAPKGTEESG